MNKRWSIAPVVISSMLVWGCSGNDNDSKSAVKSTTTLRAVHLSPDAPGVDVAVGGTVVLEDVEYRQASGFLPLESGPTQVQVLVAGTETAVIDATLDLQQDTRTTVLAINDVESIEALVISDNNDKPADGFLEIRVVHGAPAAPAVDIYVSSPEDELLSLSPTLTNVSFKAVSDELEILAGDYRIRVTPTGATDLVFDSGSVALVAGVEYLAVASQVSEGLSPIGLTVLTDTEATPVALVDDARARVRVVHASADAPEVDVSVNSGLVLDDVPFGITSDYLEVLGDTYNIDVAAAASGASVINVDLTFEPRSDTTIAVVNMLADIEALVLNDDNSAPADGNVKVRLVHAAKTAGPVDVYVTAPEADISAVEPTIKGFAFKADSGYLEVPAGDYQVRIAVADTNTIAIDTGTLSLASGAVRTAFALDPAHDATDFGVLLLEDAN